MEKSPRGSAENPIYGTGDFYTFLGQLIAQEVPVYFLLNEMTLFLNPDENTLSLITVRSTDRVKNLQAVAQLLALAQKFNLWPLTSTDILNARFPEDTN